MNVLVFVVTILMLVGILTYARIENYRNFSVLQSQFDTYMDGTERKALNSANKKLYDKTVATKKEKSKVDKEKAIKADKKISFALFTDKQRRRVEGNQLSQYIFLAKNLMQFLYNDQQFFKEAAEQRPDLLDDIIQAIITASEEIPTDQKLNDAKDLANMNLKDPVLNSTFYKMLRGTNPEKPKNGWPQFKPKKGYLSLLDFISLDTNKPIRIYLATPPVLMAIFDPNTVKEVIEARETIYRRLDNDKNLKAEDLSKEFETFKSRAKPGINQSLLNFQVSKTDPKKSR